MEKRKINHYAQTVQQVESMRRLYSKIGQPLPADIIIDLHRHLGTALQMAEETGFSRKTKQKKVADA